MGKPIIHLIAFVLAGALLVSCGSETAAVQNSQAVLPANSQSAEQSLETTPEPSTIPTGQDILPVNSPLAEQTPEPAPEVTLKSDPEPASDSSKTGDAPVPLLDHSVIQYGHPDLISDNDSTLLAYIRYPQADGFADTVISEWARETYDNARKTIDSLRETDSSAEGEINIQFDSYLSADGRFAGIIEQGMFMDAALAHPEDVIKTFNLDFQNQMLLNNADILDYLRIPDILTLLGEKLKAEWPESADYIEEANEEWLNYLAVGSDGVVVILERGACLPAYLGSVRVTLTYDELGDLLLIGREPAPASEAPPTTSLPEPETELPPAPPAGDIDPSKPMIALTFDDGPSKYTPQILDLLEQYGGRATFCVIGNLVDSGKETVKRAADMGCEIVGHSWDHRDLTKLSAEEIKAELADTNSVIESVIGTAPSLYRPPYGAVNDSLKDVSREMGFGILNWSVDTQDWKTRNTDAVYAAVMKDAADRAIVLDHDLYGTTADAMARVIPELIAQGYQLVTVSELFQYSGISPEAGTVYHNGK